MKKRIGMAMLGLTLAAGAAAAYSGVPGQNPAQAVMKFADKFFQTAYFIEAHQEPLGLSDAQLEALKDLTGEVRKRLIRENSEIEVLSIDILDGLGENPVDVKKTQSSLDAYYELQGKKAAGLVQSYASLKNILNDEQYQKLKKIWRGEPVKDVSETET